MEEIIKYTVKIAADEYGGWQGILQLDEKEYPFHSELEFLRLMGDLLEKNTPQSMF